MKIVCQQITANLFHVLDAENSNALLGFVRQCRDAVGSYFTANRSETHYPRPEDAAREVVRAWNDAATDRRFALLEIDTSEARPVADFGDRFSKLEID